MEAIILMASVRRSLFPTDKDRGAFLGRLINGIREMLSKQTGLQHQDNYHQFCRLLGRLIAWQVLRDGRPFEPAFRAALFNVTAILTGTGYASEDFNAWGGFPVALFFILALIGGCAGSTSCSAKIFRYQILTAALRIQLRRIHSPHGVYPLRYQGRAVDADVVSSVMGYFLVFSAALAVWAVLLSLTGLDTITSISGAVASLANVGPGLGAEIGPAGNYQDVNDWAKWILALGMLLGRLEFMSVLVLFTPAFWQR